MKSGEKGGDDFFHVITVGIPGQFFHYCAGQFSNTRSIGYTELCFFGASDFFDLFF